MIEQIEQLRSDVLRFASDIERSERRETSVFRLVSQAMGLAKQAIDLAFAAAQERLAEIDSQIQSERDT